MHGTSEQKRDLEETPATASKKIYSFNSLLENIFVTSLDKKKGAFINVEEVQTFKEKNEKQIKRIVEAKQLEEHVRRAEQERTRAEEQRR